jgi:inosine/xanthosine triphosphate pyrophosphatase family protein
VALKLFIGSTNPVKIAIVQAALHSLPVDLITPDDLRIKLKVNETGQTTLENAIIKAQTYCTHTNLPTLAIDGGLWIEKFAPEKQPGTRVKRIQSDEESGNDILAHYIRELQAVGGESPCTWEGGLSLAFPDQRLFTGTYQTHSILTTKVHGTAIPGTALSPITIDPETGRYYSEISPDEHPDVKKIRHFMRKIIEGMHTSDEC